MSLLRLTVYPLWRQALYSASEAYAGFPASTALNLSRVSHHMLTVWLISLSHHLTLLGFNVPPATAWAAAMPGMLLGSAATPPTTATVAESEPAAPEPEVLHCEACEKDFKNAAAMEQHLAMHVKVRRADKRVFLELALLFVLRTRIGEGLASPEWCQNSRFFCPFFRVGRPEAQAGEEESLRYHSARTKSEFLQSCV